MLINISRFFKGGESCLPETNNSMNTSVNTEDCTYTSFELEPPLQWKRLILQPYTDL
jgi:hypothetical protein